LLCVVTRAPVVCSFLNPAKDRVTCRVVKIGDGPGYAVELGSSLWALADPEMMCTRVRTKTGTPVTEPARTLESMLKVPGQVDDYAATRDKVLATVRRTVADALAEAEAASEDEDEDEDEVKGEDEVDDGGEGSSR
jgi:hypothetical protein